MQQEQPVNLTLNAAEARILGCLIEKQATTPEVYPLTLNSLQLACNQKSNREPVMFLETTEVEAAVETLIEKTLVSRFQSSRSRLSKFQHRLHQRAFDEFNFSTPELAVLGVLFLRGPQTAGEIRSRGARIYQFSDLEEVNTVLKSLEEHSDGPYLCMLARQAGRKESRYAHLFCGEVEDVAAVDADFYKRTTGSSSRVEQLEQELAVLNDKLLQLEQRFEEFTKQFE
jgi:uncharacterized protein YceH (UPF0502 family)